MGAGILGAAVSILLIIYYIPGTWGQVDDQMCGEYCGKNCFFEYQGSPYALCQLAMVACDCEANPPKVAAVQGTRAPNPKFNATGNGTTQNNGSNSDVSKDGDTTIIVIIVLILLVLGGVGVFCLWRIRKKRARQAAGQAQVAPGPMQPMEPMQPGGPPQQYPQLAGQQYPQLAGQQYPQLATQQQPQYPQLPTGPQAPAKGKPIPNVSSSSSAV